MKLILLGAPGAGKGTQSAILCEKLGIPTFSTGHRLRTAIREGTPVGEIAKKYLDKGMLVPDEIVTDMIRKRLEEADCEGGYILDGVPRTIGQAEALEEAGILLDSVVSLEISDDEIVQRMAGRRVCRTCGASYHLVSIPPKAAGICDRCGSELVQRDDDKPETVKYRLEVYHKETEPLKDFYAKRGLLRSVENQPTVEETTAAILHALGR